MEYGHAGRQYRIQERAGLVLPVFITTGREGQRRLSDRSPPRHERRSTEGKNAREECEERLTRTAPLASSM